MNFRTASRQEHYCAGFIKGLLIFCILNLFSSCQYSNNQLNAVKEDNIILRKKIDSLTQALNELKDNPAIILADIKNSIQSKKYTEARSTLKDLIKKYPATNESAVGRKLLPSIEYKANAEILAEEKIVFNDAINKKDVSLLQSYIEKYPSGKYVSKAKKAVRQLEIETTSYGTASPSTNYASPTIYESAKPAKKQRSQKISSGERTGALCCDGTTSSATGRGACSHHGGVCQWLY